MLNRLLKPLWPLLLGLVCLANLAHAAGEPLEPTRAFQFSARAIDAQTIEARWQIADGYYMYRDKFRFEVEPATVKLGSPQFPPGKLKDDDVYGKVETYRDEVVIRLNR